MLEPDTVISLGPDDLGACPQCQVRMTINNDPSPDISLEFGHPVFHAACSNCGFFGHVCYDADVDDEEAPMGNQKRAENVRVIIALARQGKLLDDNEELTCARDLATNIMHFFRGCGVDPHSVMTQCMEMFDEEELEDGPQAALDNVEES